MDLAAVARALSESLTSSDAHGPSRSERTKRGLLWLAGVRVGLALVAIPLAPFLYLHHFLVLVLLRPSMGVLLAGAILAREGHTSLPAMLGAAVPLQLVAVWLYFLLGDAWQEDIDSDDRLPFFTARLLQPGQIRHLRQTLRSGEAITLVFLGRRSIGGLRSGSTLTAERMVGKHNGKLAMINPAYELLTPSGSGVEL